MSRLLLIVAASLTAFSFPSAVCQLLAQSDRSVLSASQKRELIHRRDQLGDRAGKLRQNGQLSEAIDCVLEMVEIEKRVSGPEDPEVAGVLDYLADLLVETRQWKQAIDAKTEATSIWSRSYGADHWRSRTGQDNLVLLQTKATLSDADLQRLEVAEDRLHFADLWMRVGLPEIAADEIQQSINAFEQLLPPSSSLHGLAAFRLARSQYSRGLDTEAMSSIDRALEVYRTALGKDHRDYGVMLQTESEIAGRQLDFERSLRAIRECRDIRTKSMRRDDPRLIKTFETVINTAVNLAWKSLETSEAAKELEDVRIEIQQAELLLESEDPVVTRANALLSELNSVAGLSQADRGLLSQIRRHTLERSRQQTSSELLSGETEIHEAFLRMEDDRRTIEKHLSDATPLWGDVTACMVRLAEASGEIESATQLSALAAACRIRLFWPHSVARESVDETSRLLRTRAVNLFAAGDWSGCQQLTEAHEESFSSLFDPDDSRSTEMKTLHQELSVLEEQESVVKAKVAEAMALRSRANEQRQAGRLVESVESLERAVQMVDSLPWNASYLQAFLLHDLGVAQIGSADHAAALISLRKARKEWEDLLGSEHPRVAGSATELAWCLLQTNNPEEGIQEAQEAITIFAKSDREHLTALARAFEVAGLSAMNLNAHKAAEDALVNAAEIRLEVHGNRHRDVARSWHNLGVEFHSRGNSPAATALLKNAAILWEQLDESADLARCLDQLAQVQFESGDISGSHDSAMRSGEVFRDVLKLPSEHPDVLVNKALQAECLAAKGQLTEAAEQIRPVVQASLSRWRQTAASLSSSQRLQSVEKLRTYVDQFIDYSRDDPRLQEERYSYCLSYRGMVMNFEQQIATLASEANDPGVAVLKSRLSQLQPEITSRVFLSSSSDEAEQNRKELNALVYERQQLESQLSELLKFREFESVSVAQVRDALPANVVFVDFHHLRRIRAINGGTARERVLTAFVSNRDEPVEMIELGEADLIEEAIRNWRRSFGHGDSIHHASAIQLRSLIWNRLPKKVHDARVVLLSPEGFLSQFPWGALPGRDPARFLIEEQAIVVIPAAQLIPRLLKTPSGPMTQPRILMVGGISFDSNADVGTSADISFQRPGIRWRDLPGTASEATSLTNVLRSDSVAKQVTQLTQSAADASSVRAAIQNAEWIHLATHGFFDPPELRQLFQSQAIRTGSDLGGLRFGLSPTELEPEMLSGLVFAGANRLANGQRCDSIISAREISGLDLSHIQLVCLSACETGLGEAHESESSLGLSRSFHVAGARTCVASLWRVDDAATERLMLSFYKHLLEGKLSKAECLQAAQIEMIRSQSASNSVLIRGATIDAPTREQVVGSPYFWASFVLSGDWR